MFVPRPYADMLPYNLQLDCVQYCIKTGIFLVLLPPNSTSLLQVRDTAVFVSCSIRLRTFSVHQPLDARVFGPLKSYF